MANGILDFTGGLGLVLGEAVEIDGEFFTGVVLGFSLGGVILLVELIEAILPICCPELIPPNAGNGSRPPNFAALSHQGQTPKCPL